MNKLQPLPPNPTEDQIADFTMEMIRHVFDSNEWLYWVYCNNRLISIGYYEMQFTVTIEGNKAIFYTNAYLPYDVQLIERLKEWKGGTNINLSMAFPKEIDEEYVDPYTGDISMIKRTEGMYEFRSELEIKPTTDADYLRKLSEEVYDIFETITDAEGIFNHYRLSLQQSEEDSDVISQ